MDGLFPLLANRLLISSMRRPSLRGLGELVPPDLAKNLIFFRSLDLITYITQKVAEM